ncbi:MAG: bifunctional diaminohydroxyphosphoribosylaminopyrimidine deaminase/5-amino-6-(5-phosphoribosylamino)uracil reductase RibD [Chloroflexi bacterium]|nr:bifunctional diaminohydroxyphosphoribosylaminopyrimidine deaminase/5-amino-6-(5-phosphoribosylamino)uracil reductase RibD [Chloroflexota bacterium]
MDYMARALALARQALGNVSPNPAVGAVMVRDGQVIGEGCTQPPGGAHAEVMALKAAGPAARGAALYVTLEPCCHKGRTPPCTGAIIAAGLGEVHLAALDPNPLVNGRGKAELETAGIRVRVGEREEEAQELNEAFFKYITTGLPFVTAKFAASLDGKIATRSRQSQWLSGEEARRFGHRLRQISDAVLVGVETALADDPRLTARLGGEGRQPLRIILDSQGRTMPKARLFREPGPVLIATAGPIPLPRRRALESVGAEVVALPAEAGHVALATLLRELGRRQVTSLLVEGGGTVLGAFFDAGLVDRATAVLSPLIIGGREAVSAVAGHGAETLAQAWRLAKVRTEVLGQDIAISGRIVGEG